MLYYKRHIGDYIKDASHLSLLEHGVYARLMDVYYTKEKPLSDDDAIRLIGAESKPEMAAVKAVLKEFWEKTPDGWIQSRCDYEIERAHNKAGTNRNNGKAGGRPKGTGKKSDPKNNPVGFQNGTGSEPSGGPSETLSNDPTIQLSNDPTIQSSVRGYQPLTFEQAQQAQAVYPIGIFRQSEWLIAEKLINWHLANGIDFSRILASFERYRDQVTARGKIGSEFVLSPVKHCDRERPLFDEPFPVPRTRAESRQSANVDAGQQWLQESAGAA